MHEQKPSYIEVLMLEHGYMRVEASGIRLFCEVSSLIDLFKLRIVSLQNLVQGTEGKVMCRRQSLEAC